MIVPYVSSNLKLNKVLQFAIYHNKKCQVLFFLLAHSWKFLIKYVFIGELLFSSIGAIFELWNML